MISWVRLTTLSKFISFTLSESVDETYTLMKQQSALNDLWRTYCIHAYKAGEHQLNMLCLTWKKNGEHGGIIWCTEIHYKDIFSSLQSPHLYWWIISHVWWNRTPFRWSCLINSHPLILVLQWGRQVRESCAVVMLDWIYSLLCFIVALGKEYFSILTMYWSAAVDMTPGPPF